MSTSGSTTGTPGPTVEPLCEHGSAVRFETQCVVIPDHVQRSRRPRVVTKSYALPLWKRRSSSAGPSTSSPPQDPLLEENHLVLRVPVPTFSFNKPRSTSRSIDHTPLPPCLVHRPHPSGFKSPSTSMLPRHTRPPRQTSPSPRPDIVTVPLRPCCAACQSVTEAALAYGDTWQEHFSRAASRRRSMSVDSPRTMTVAGSAASVSYGNLGVSINVDEIDKRRRASDTGPSTTSSRTWSNDTNAKEEGRVSSILRRGAVNSSAVDARSPPSPTRITPTTPRIPEEEDDEDENELFPLPSPKRTPRTSPASSPAGSLSSLTVPPTHQKPTNSPTPSSCSGDSHESQPTNELFHTPPLCSFTSFSLSLPELAASTANLALPENPPRAESPRLLSTLPTLSGRRRSVSPSPHTLPTPTDTLPSATDSTPPHTPRSPGPLPIPTPIITPRSPRSSSFTSPRISPTNIRFPWRPKFSVSTDVISPTPSFSPSTSPPLSTSPNTKKSFAMPKPRAIITDVIRGVGVMGSSGMGPRM